MSCPSCCNNCSQGDRSSKRIRNPNLLPVGSLFLKLKEPHALLCDHTRHAPDGWHKFQQSIKPHLVSELLGEQIRHLVTDRYIEATYRNRPTDGGLIVRVYVDVGVVQGLGQYKGSSRDFRIHQAARKRTQSYLEQVLTTLTNTKELWDALEGSGEGSSLVPKDGRPFAQIYSELRSPSPDPVPGYGGISTRLLECKDALDGLGIWTTLYRYQRRSVAAMLQRELDERDVPDPLFIPLTTVDQSLFFLQPETLKFQVLRPMMSPPRGGILCEKPGTGKTLIILTLISATKNQISAPETSSVNSPVMTPLSFRHFPSGEIATWRKKLLGENDRHNSPENSRVPSLVELMLHRGRTAPYCNIPKGYSTQHTKTEGKVYNLPLAEMLRENRPFYFHDDGGQGFGPKFRLVYLTSATLVVVPAKLFSHWDQEITKHCSTSLRVLLMTTEIQAPSVESLASDYDIIITTYSRFTKESSPQNSSKLKSWQPCSCEKTPSSRVPICRCESDEVSPFLKIRWKRLVIDEDRLASESGAISTALMTSARLLSAERTWFITSTPITNLSGLNLGSKVGHEDLQLRAIQASRTIQASRRNKPASNDVEDDEVIEIGFRGSRRWSKKDHKDLNKLGNLITIIMPQYRARHSQSLIASRVIQPLLDVGGPKPGSIQVLVQFMETIMIQHAEPDLEGMPVVVDD